MAPGSEGSMDMHVSLCFLLCVVARCALTRSVKQHIDTNRSDIRGTFPGPKTNANVGRADSRLVNQSETNSNENGNTHGVWNRNFGAASSRHRDTNANGHGKSETGGVNHRQETNTNVRHNPRSWSDRSVFTNKNVLYKENPENSGQRSSNSHVGRDANRSDRYNGVHGNITNYTVQRGVKHDASPNESTNKNKDEGPNETIHATENDGASSSRRVHKEGRHPQESVVAPTPPPQSASHISYAVLVLVVGVPVLFGMVWLVFKWHARSERVTDNRSSTDYMNGIQML